MDYKYPTPQLLFKAICNAIRSKTGNSDEIPHQNIPDELDSIITEEEYEIAVQELSNIICGSEVKVLDSKYIPYIASYKFYGSDLITIDLPECTSICDKTFQNCTNLTTVNLPECTSIGNDAFYNCTSLTNVNLPKCTSIGGYAFYSCTNLTNVNLSECTSIGVHAFDHCTNLTTIDLLECTSIRDMAFYNCTSLTNVNLPKCTSIGDAAFMNCTSLTTIILSNNQVVTLMGSNAIARTGYIYVPDGLINNYKTATKWSTYANQIKPLSELPSNLKEEYGYD